MERTEILTRYNERKQEKDVATIAFLRARHPKYEGWTDEELIAANQDHVSRFQSKDGKWFERYIEGQFTALGLPFKAQVHVDGNGMIVASKGVMILDIVFGNPQVGTHISNYLVLSLKTSSRERAKLDTWTRIHAPKVFYYGSIEADYPIPETFQESETRKLVCVKTREIDTRQFKLDFLGLVEEVKRL
jgi:hypothetical protein